ncbi:hypothetical protein [Fodinibacter luteus]|uniref:hypothetical protein n=1 Tax=Fodinibacter luteus TaxID=552064 RepID=UPI0031E9C44F
MTRYEIVVEGEVGPLTAAAIEGFEARADEGRTHLVGDVVDQAAFHGLLNRCQDLRLEIVEIHRLGEHEHGGAPGTST